MTGTIASLPAILAAVHAAGSFSGFAPALAFIAPSVFWPYFDGAVVLAIGLVVVNRYENPRAQGAEKMLNFGRLFFAVPMAVFGTEHFTATAGIAKIVPSWMPAHLFWTYLVGTCLLAAALSIAANKRAGLAAALLGLMLFLFVLMIHIPNFAAHPDRFTLAVPLRDLSFSGAALAYAGTQTETWRAHRRHILVTFGRYFIAIAAVFFGVESILHPDFVPTVPFNKVTPSWIPGHALWTYLAGAVLIVGGLSLLANRKARLAAMCMGLVVLLTVLFVYLPMEAAIPSDIGNGLNFFADTLAYGGGLLLLAQALAPEAAEIVIIASPS
ncbi:MAG: DoxX family membrane protein [Terriglobia bacterium]